MYLLFCSTKQHCHTDGRGEVGDLCVFSCIHIVSLISVLPCLFFLILIFFLPVVHAEYFPFLDCWSLFPVALVLCFFGFGWVHSRHSRFALQMKITWKPSSELLVFTEKADKLFLPKPHLLGLFCYLVSFFLNSERRRNLLCAQGLHSAFGPCWTRHCINMY